MKAPVKTLSLLLGAALLAAALTACGGTPAPAPTEKPAAAAAPASATPAPTPAATAAPETEAPAAEPENYLDISGVDFSAPDIVIAYDDYDRMHDLAKDMQNFAVPVGTVVEIHGEVGSSMMSHTVQVPSADGSKRIGTTFEVVGMEEGDIPAAETRIHIVGVIRTNDDAFNVLVVPAERFQVEE